MYLFQMVILCAREEHELFENCYRGSKTISARDLKKWQQNEVEKSNFLRNLHHKYLIGPLIYAVKSRRSKLKCEDDHKDQRDGDDSQFCQGTDPVFTLIMMPNALNETEADVSK